MARGVHNLGHKRTEGFKSRVRAGIARRQATGRPFGHPRIHPIRIGVCEHCGGRFRWTRGSAKAMGITGPKSGRFCAKPCLVQWLHNYRQRLPDAETLRRHYWDEGMSLWTIARLYEVESHKSVSAALEKAGIPRRERRNVGASTCDVAGCNKPPFKLKHPNNGSMYGKRCAEHQVAHRKQLAVDYYARTGGARGFADKVCAELARGARLTSEIAAVTQLSIKTVSNTLTHLRRNGRVESSKTKPATWRLIDCADSRTAMADREIAA